MITIVHRHNSLRLYPCVQTGVLFILLLAGFHLNAQVQLDPEQKLGSTRQDSIPAGIMPLDTPVPMTYVLIGHPDQPIVFKDTFSWADIRHIPFSSYQAHLGNYGSASRSLIPEPGGPIGFSTGWFQYDSSYITEETFRYYNQDIPVAKIKYSQASQEDTYLTLDFGRNFAKGLSLSIAYKRVNQVGEFAHQRQKNTALSLGVWHNAPSGRYDAFYNYLNNSAVTQENGGIAVPELIGAENVPDNSVPVFLTLNNENAITTHKQRTFMTLQIFHLLKDTTSIGIDLWIKGSYGQGLFKYVDGDTLTGREYYGEQFYTDPRGIRQYTFYQKNEWTTGLTIPWKSIHSTIRGAVRYRGFNLDQEPYQRNIHEFYVDADGEFQWIAPLKLKGELSLGFGQANGLFSFRADGELDGGVLGKFSGYWSIMSRRPFMIESALYVSQLPVYNIEFENPLTNNIGVAWKIEKQKLEVGIKWLVYDNYIYFDSLRLPSQLENSFSLRRLYASKGFDFSSFGFTAGGFWQPDPKAELAVPEWGLSGSAYGRIPVFKGKVILIPGADVLYTGGFTGISYFPVNGVYHLTGKNDIPDAFRLDMGLGLKINFIKFFVRMEDIVGLFENRVLYQADYYPYYRGYFRIGFETSFFN